MIKRKRYDYGVISGIVSKPWDADTAADLNRMAAKVFDEGEPSSTYDALSRVIDDWRRGERDPRAAATIVFHAKRRAERGEELDPRWFELAAELYRAPLGDDPGGHIPILLGCAPHPERLQRLAALVAEAGGPVHLALLRPLVAASDPAAQQPLIDFIRLKPGAVSHAGSNSATHRSIGPW